MKPQKFVTNAVIVIFLAVLFGFGIAFWICPDKDFSQDENRVLQTLPRVTWERWADGKVTQEFTEYCSDQFPLRSTFVTVRSLYDLALLRGESNGVLYGKNGQQAVRLFDAYISRSERAYDTDYASDEHIDAGVSALIQLNETLREDGKRLIVFPAPRTVDVVYTASDYPTQLSDALHSRIFDGLTQGGVSCVDVLSDFRTRYASGEYIMYRTDHHWTTQGAYLGYVALMNTLGQAQNVISDSVYTVESVDNFVGTTASRSGFPVANPDVLSLYGTESDTAYAVRQQDGTLIMNGFISRNYLDTKDKYGAFMDGTHNLVTVTLEGRDALSATTGTRPRILLARDSFANALIPFLARHYDIVSVNLPAGLTDLSALAETYDCETVVILCNLENFVTSDCIRTVR